jgi:hypothetical protein
VAVIVPVGDAVTVADGVGGAVSVAEAVGVAVSTGFVSVGDGALAAQALVSIRIKQVNQTWNFGMLHFLRLVGNFHCT